MPARKTLGAASVEYLALSALVALVLAAAIAALIAGPPSTAEKLLARQIARRLVCAPRLHPPCRPDPLAAAYGRRLGGAIRALAPAPAATATGLVPVDFRRCRRASCAMPGAAIGLTSAGRRVTAFTSVRDLRRGGGAVEISYWLYRPSSGWARVVRSATSADVAALGATPLLESASPALVPLETLPGRNHYRFTRDEEPPWRWLVPGRYPG